MYLTILLEPGDGMHELFITTDLGGVDVLRGTAQTYSVSVHHSTRDQYIYISGRENTIIPALRVLIQRFISPSQQIRWSNELTHLEVRVEQERARIYRHMTGREWEAPNANT